MRYEVIASDFTKLQFKSYVDYLRYVLHNEQAADNPLDDADLTEDALSKSAGSLKYCEDPDLRALEYRIILFRTHRYLWIYKVIDDVAEIHAMYHELQDYENLFKTDVLSQY